MGKTSKFFLEKLMSLPHRGNNTPELEKAAEIIFREYENAGFKSQYVEFDSIEGGFFSGSFAMLLFLFAAMAIWLDKTLLALFFYILGWVFYTGKPPIWDELFIRFKPFKAKSVFVEVSPSQKTEKTIVISGHYDTARVTAGINILKFINKISLGKKLFSSNEKAPSIFRGPFFLINITIILLGLFFIVSPQGKIGFVLFSIVFFLLMLSFLTNFQAAASPPVPGAFDNGSGAAVVMALAANFFDKPLKNTRLIFLNNPCEEGCVSGFEAFFEKAKIDKTKTHFIVLDGVGAKNLKIAYGEIGHILGMTRYCDRELYNVASRLIKGEERFASIKEFFLPVQSDATNIINKGGKVGLIVASLDDHGFVDHYHQMSDTIEKINFQTMDLCHDFVAELIKKIDGSFL